VTALESVRQKQKVDSAQDVDRDVIACARDGRDAVAAALQIREGILIGRQDFHLSVDPEVPEGEFVAGFIRQYYHRAENLPQEVYLAAPIDEQSLTEAWLSAAKGEKVVIVVPQKGEKHRLVAMAEANARLLLDELMLQKQKYRDKAPASASALQKVLGLAAPPQTISCFDISNLGATDKAASLVYFEKGKPKKSEYRHFRVKTIEGQDDFGAMREVITRYVTRAKGESRPLPDLMMVDGGKGQLAVAKEVLDGAGFSAQPLIGLAKKLEELFVPGQTGPVSIRRDSPALALLKRVRDEAHRFAITYHRQLRKKRLVKSALDAIPGVGPARREALLRHFGSVKKIREATAGQIAEAPGISARLAEQISTRLSESAQNHGLGTRPGGIPKND
jgi:excinuclease ABC subunit C